MIGYHAFRIVFAAATLIAAQSAWADSAVLSVTGMVTSSNANGVQVGAGNYTA